MILITLYAWVAHLFTLIRYASKQGQVKQPVARQEEKTKVARCSFWIFNRNSSELTTNEKTWMFFLRRNVYIWNTILCFLRIDVFYTNTSYFTDQATPRHQEPILLHTIVPNSSQYYNHSEVKWHNFKEFNGNLVEFSENQWNLWNYTPLPLRTFKLATITRFYHLGFSKLAIVTQK